MHLPLTPSRAQVRQGRMSPAMHAMLALLVVLLAAPTQCAIAQDATESLAPIANILSAPSWLLATGQDPRGLIGAPSGGWQDGSGDPPAGSITRQIGLISASTSPSLAINPKDPSHLVLAVDAFDLPGTATYVSEDGGDSWLGPSQVAPLSGDLGTAGAPVVAFDSEGTAYLVSRSIGTDSVQAGDRAQQALRERIIVSRSVDGGRTWLQPAIVAGGGAESVAATGPQGEPLAHLTTRFLDAPTLAIGPDPDAPDRDLLAVAYTELKLTSTTSADAATGAPARPAVTSTIRLVHSGNGGQSWSDPVAVSPEVSQELAAPQGPAPPLPSDLVGVAMSPTPSPRGGGLGDQVLQGAQASFLSDGSLVVAYLDSTVDGAQQGLAVIRVARSHDGGSSFSPPVRAGVFHEIGARPNSAFFRWWDGAFPHMVAGAHDELYLAVAARSASDPGDEGDIALFRSVDKGDTWESMPNPTNATRGAQFFPALAVAPDGDLHLCWADLGQDPSGASFAVNYAVSHDAGESWASETVAVASGINTLVGSPGGSYLGHGLAMAASSEQVAAAWPVTAQTPIGGPSQQVTVAALPRDE